MTKSIDKIKKIKSVIQQISYEEDSVREYINTTRYQTDLLKDLDIWNKICCSLDTIGDTIYSIDSYISLDYPEDNGLKYIFTYGLLQSLFIQQDAIKHLAEAFEVNFDSNDKLKNIRTIRNASIGHPTKNNVNGMIYYNYISRITLSKNGFKLMRSSERDRAEFIDVDLLSIIAVQLNEIGKSYKLISSKLIEADRMHREKHKNKLVVDLFHSSMGYLYSKIAEGINSTRAEKTIGLGALTSIEKIFKEFKTELEERNEFNDYIKYDLEEYKYALKTLKSYFEEKNDFMSERDARIYLFYIRKNHSDFVEIAKEIDEEYNKKK